jgi:hypothetical protein
MKNLITTDTGGFPFTLDRLRWMDEGHKEALKALCLSLLPPGATSMILQGCEITTTATPGLYNVAAGWVYLDTVIKQEICEVDAHSFQADPALNLVDAYWDSVVSYDLSGSVTFFDGSNKQVHQVIKAKVFGGQGSQENPRVLDVPAINGTWVTFASLSLVEDNLSYKITKFGLSIKGSITGISSDLYTLPEKFRPKQLTRITLTPADSSVVYVQSYLVIQTNGLVKHETNQSGPNYNDYYVNTIINID